jgi:uncharacterized short protein YbdD (DUF466 family)
MTTKEIVTEARDRVERVAKVVRRIIGVPDYDRYVAHVQSHYPETTPMCRRDFERQRVTDKYSRPGGRCC